MAIINLDIENPNWMNKPLKLEKAMLGTATSIEKDLNTSFETNSSTIAPQELARKSPETSQDSPAMHSNAMPEQPKDAEELNDEECNLLAEINQYLISLLEPKEKENKEKNGLEQNGTNNPSTGSSTNTE